MEGVGREGMGVWTQEGRSEPVGGQARRKGQVVSSFIITFLLSFLWLRADISILCSRSPSVSSNATSFPSTLPTRLPLSPISPFPRTLLRPRPRTTTTPGCFATLTTRSRTGSRSPPSRARFVESPSSGWPTLSRRSTSEPLRIKTIVRTLFPFTSTSRMRPDADYVTFILLVFCCSAVQACPSDWVTHLVRQGRLPCRSAGLVAPDHACHVYVRHPDIQ